MFSMFNIPNIFTACNMLCGIISVVLSLSGRIDLAPYPVFIGAILDFFDGFLARILKKQSELGKQLDSLADMVTFGVAPGIIMMVLLSFMISSAGSQMLENYGALPSGPLLDNIQIAYQHWIRNVIELNDFSFIPFIALLIPFMSLFRLAKFNIDTRQSVSFIGLPTPANTIFFTAFPLIYTTAASPGLEQTIIGFVFQPAVLIAIIIVMSLLLVAEIPLFALKFKTFKWNGNQIRYLFLITCLILIPTLLVWAIPIIVLLYIILSVIENILKKKTT